MIINYAHILRHYADDSLFASKYPTGKMLGLADALDELERTARRFSGDPTPEHNKELTDAITALVSEHNGIIDA